MLQVTVVSLLIAVVAASRPVLDGRIVGGQNADIADFPYQLSLQSHKRHICGASIISEKWALTAAHCTDGSSVASLSVVAGVTKLNEYGGQRLEILRIHQHPDFTMSNLDSDVSLLELRGRLEFNEFVNAIPLVEEGYEPEGNKNVLVSGWGTTREGGYVSNQLQFVNIKIISRRACVIAYGDAISERMICAGVVNGGKDACQGDSGGPLAGDGQQVGVVSWGYGCARPSYPGVYSNIGSLRSYIKTISGI